LGAPALLYLAAMGVGRLGLVEFDTVAISNLHRQVLYTTAEVGQPKGACALKRLRALNPEIEVQWLDRQLTPPNALETLRGWDLVLDGTDNFATRYLVNDTCVLLDIPLVSASVLRFEGQLGVFHAPLPDGSRSPNYRDLFPFPPAPDSVPDCATGGVLGILPGVLGTLQALEAVKLLTGLGNPLVGQLAVFDAMGTQLRTLRLYPNPENPLRTRLSQHDLANDYDFLCTLNPDSTSNASTDMTIPEIDVQTLKAWRDENKPHQLIDVRNPDEYAFCNLGGELIPLGDVAANVDKIAEDLPVVLQCRSGGRSAQALLMLRQLGVSAEMYNLKGGILAWSDQIDPSVPKY
jgi:adenylyltransferase/sulfurtransferase